MSDRMRTIYLVQHVAGYSRDGYEKSSRRLTDAGFIRCRSEIGDNGKYWEVWLGYDLLFAGPLKGGQSKEAILAWLMHEVRPGEISVAVEQEHWGLGAD